MNVKNLLGVLLFLGIVSKGISQGMDKNYSFYIGLEVMEPIATQFHSFGLSMGTHSSDNFDLGGSFSFLNLPATHLSNPRVGSVDGENVEGKVRLGRLYANYYPFGKSKKIFLKSLYFVGNVGYVTIDYQHLITTENYGVNSIILGSGIGVFQRNLFKIRGLFLDFTVPVMYLFNSLEAEYLDETLINQQRFMNQGWVFIGYEF